MTGKELKAMISSIPDESSVTLNLLIHRDENNLLQFNEITDCTVVTEGSFADLDDDFYAKTNITFDVM